MESAKRRKRVISSKAINIILDSGLLTVLLKRFKKYGASYITILTQSVEFR